LVIGKKEDYAAVSSSFLYQKLPVTKEAAEIFASAIIADIRNIHNKEDFIL